MSKAGSGAATVGEEARCGWDGGAAGQEPALTLDGRRLAAGRGKHRPALSISVRTAGLLAVR